MMSRIVRAQMRRMEAGDVTDVAAAAIAEERLAAVAVSPPLQRALSPGSGK